MASARFCTRRTERGAAWLCGRMMAQSIERGAEVVVMRYQRGVGYVRRWDEFEDGLMGGHVRHLEGESTKD